MVFRLINVTKETRLAIFQHKIIHYILPTNLTLFKDSIKKHDNCHLCGEIQTLTDPFFFVTCSKARLFRSLSINWCNFQNGDTINLDENEMIYGVTDNFARRLGLNLCMIIAKHYIYTASRKDEEFHRDASL